MFVFAFAGELFAFIVNGDRFVLLALLPRRKPRTDGSVQPPYHSLFKELNLTTGGYYPSRVPFSRWHGFLCIVAVAPLPYINPRQMRLGFTKFLRMGRADARRFRFRASFQSAGAIASRSFRRSLRSLSLRYDNRCRSRSSCPRSRARGPRSTSTGTGSRWQRCNRGESHEPTFYQHLHYYP